MRRNRYRRALGESITHYKLYKAKKNWVIAGITMFGFGLGAASILAPTTVAAATVTTESASKPATTSVAPVANASSAQVANTKTSAAPASSAKAESTTAKAVTVASSAATSSAAPASSAKAESATAKAATLASSAAPASATKTDEVAASTATSSAVKAESATAKAAPASTAKAESTTAKTATPASTSKTDSAAAKAIAPASSAASSAANKATSTDTKAASPVASSAAPQLKTPPVKSGTTASATIVPVTAGNNKITTSGIDFTVNFTGAVGDVITVKIDGVDVSDTLFPGSTTKYASISNVQKATMGVTTAVNDNALTDTTNQNGAIVDTLTLDGSYSQNFTLKAAGAYTYYSPTATASSTETANKNIEVYINGQLATSTTYQLDYKVVPIRVTSPNSYNDMSIYSTDPVIFQLPSFRTSTYPYQYIPPVTDLLNMGATAAEYRIAMPTGFKLDTTKTATLNNSRPFTISQDQTTGEIVLTYKDLTTVAKDTSYAQVYVAGSFNDYVANTSVTATTPNKVSIKISDGTTVTTTSTSNNIFKYADASAKKARYATVPQKDYLNTKDSDTTAYIDLQRATADDDSFNLTSGFLNYYGPAVKNANNIITVPNGFTASEITVNVAQKLLDADGVTTLPYQVTYTDGSTASGTLTGVTNVISLDTTKTVKNIAYQYDIPATPMVAFKQSEAEAVTGATSYIANLDYISLPSTTITLGTDSDVTVGAYTLGSTLTETDAAGSTFTTKGDLKIQVIDGTKDAYVSLKAKGQTQTSTSAGELLTGTGNTTMSRAYLSPKNGLALSNGDTSSSADSLARFVNQPVFYFVAPAQTHFVVDMATIKKDIPGIQLTNYVTTDGHQAYKIDLSQATSQDFGLRGDYSYSDDEPIAVPGVFRLDTYYGIVERLVNLFEIQADPDAVTSTDDLRIYYSSQNQINDVSSGLDTSGAMTGDANAIVVPVENATYKIQNMSGVFGLTMIQGSNDSGYSRTGTTAIYQALDDNQFALNIQNLTTTPLKNVSELINLPTVGDGLGSEFNVQLAGAATSVPTGVTVLYSTTAQTQQTAAGAHPDATGYVAADQVTDWSTIKSILIQTPTLAANASLGRVIFNVADPTQVADINKTAYFDSGTYADSLTPIILGKTAAANMTVKGAATVNYAFLLPDGTKVAAPSLAQVLTIGTDKVASPLPTIKAADLPTGYRLINANGQAITSTANQSSYKVGTVVNSTADYSGIKGDNTAAKVGAVATYAADGDTVLIPVTDTTTQKMQYKYIDDTTATTLDTTDLTGASLTPTTTTTTATITSYKNKGYVLVSDATNGQAMVFDDDATKDQVYEIHFKHGTIVPTTTTPGTPGSLIPGTPTKWPKGTAATDLASTVTRTIHYVYSDGGTAAPDKTQPANFKRAAVVDKVTGALLGYLAPAQVTAYQADPTSVTLSPTDGWAPATTDLAAVANPTPTKAGYATTDTVAKVTVAPGDANPEQTVTYHPEAQKATVTYIDESNGKQVLQVDHLTGVTNSTQDYTQVRNVVQGAYENLGYAVTGTSGNALSGDNQVTFDTDTKTDQNTDIYLKHVTTVTTPGEPETPGTPIGKTPNKWPNEAGAQNLSRTVTQTIHYVYSDGTSAAPDQTQSVTFQQAAVVDQVTGTVLGYLAPAQVAAYQADPTSVTLATDNAWTVTTGNADFKAVTSPAAKAGYTPDLAATAAYTVTPTTGNADLTVTYVPDAQKATVTYVDADNGDQVLQTDNLAGVTAGTQDYTKVRNVVQGAYENLGYVYDHATGNALDTNNVVTFDTDAKTDQATTIYLKHKTTTVTPDQPQTPGEPLVTTPNKWPSESGAQNLSRTVTQTIHYVYSDGTSAAPDQTQSVTFQQVAVVDQVTGTVLGYLAPEQVAAYQADPTSVTLAANNAWTVTTGNADFKAVTSPAAKAGYTPDVATTTAYTVTPDTGSAVLTVTYTPDAQKATVTYVDADNGDQVLQTDNLAGVTAGTQDYTKVRQAVQTGYAKLGYVYDHETGNALDANNVVTFDTDAKTDQATTIYLKHSHLTVTPDQPQTPDTPLPNTPDPKKPNHWPAGVNALDLNRKVTATAQFVYSTGGKVGPDQTQTATFSRGAIVDGVTGALLGYLTPDQVAAYQADPTSVTLTPTGGWDQTQVATDFTLPTAKPGYTPDLKQMATYDLTPTSGDLKLTVTYTPDAQKATVTYVDADNGDQVLQTDQLAGVTAGTQDYTKVRNVVQNAYEKLGYVYDHATGNALDANNVVTFDTDAKTDQATTIYLKHKTTTVTPDQPQTPGEPLLTTPNKWPNESGAQNLSRTVNQTIHYVYSDGTSAAPDQTQSVTFQQAAVVDHVTGTVLGYLAPDQVAAYQADPTSVTLATDNAWTVTTGNADFKAVTSPVVKAGYTPDVAITAAYQVTPDTGSAVLTVTYTPDAQKATVTYVDASQGNQVLHVDTLTGVTDSQTDYAKVRQAMLGGFTALGYVYDHQAGNLLNADQVAVFDADATTDQKTTVYLTHGSTVVTPNEPQVPGNKIPNNPNTWPNGTDHFNLSRTVTENVHYVYAEGGKAAPDQQQSVTFQRAAIVDTATGALLGYVAPGEVAAYQANPAGYTFTTDGWTITAGNAAFTSVASPKASQPGYSPDLTATQAYAVTPTTGNSDLTVTYTKDTQKATIQYVDLDANNAVLQSDAITGLTGTDLDYTKPRQAIQSGYVKLGYVVDHTDLPANNVFTFDNNTQKNQTATIYLKHGTVPVTPNDPQTPGDTIPQTPTKWPAGVNTQDLQRTVTETVQYVYADGGKASADQHQSVTFQRAAIVDAVTGTVRGYLAPDQVAAYQADPTSVALTTTGWDHDNATLPAITSPTAKAGYTVDLPATQAYTVTPTTGNLALTVTYTPDAQQATIQYVDLAANNAVLQSKSVSGVSNGTLDYGKVRQAITAGYEKLGYVVDHTDLPSDNVITFDTNDAQPQKFTVYLQHGTTTVTPNEPKVPGTPIPNRPSTWPQGTTTQALNRTVTETIQYVYADGGKAAPDYQQQVTFQRVAVVDQVTGDLLGYLAPDQVAAYQANPTSVTLSDQGWAPSTGAFKAVMSPAGKAGYTADRATVTAYDVNPNTGNLSLTVTYNADAQKAVINYVDDDNQGKQVHQDQVSGVSNGTLAYAKVQNAVEAGLRALGYTVGSSDLPANSVITFDDQNQKDQVYTIHLHHQSQPVTPAQPGQPGEPMRPDQPAGPTWPHGTDLTSLQKIVTETVHYVYADGTTAAPTVTDYVTFVRQGLIDKVTGAVTYTAWTPVHQDTTFTAKTSPVLPGYTADQTQVAAINGLTANSANVVVTVTYHKLGAYVPNLPGISQITYPNEPTEPSQPNRPQVTIPYVPGYVPYGPNGEPLQPMVPSDPSQGYVPPVPTDVNTDTPITYQPNTPQTTDEPGTPTGTTTGEPGTPTGTTTNEPGTPTGTTTGEPGTPTGTITGEPGTPTGTPTNQPGQPNTTATGEPGVPTGTTTAEPSTPVTNQPGTAANQPSLPVGPAGIPAATTGKPVTPAQQLAAQQPKAQLTATGTPKVAATKATKATQATLPQTGTADDAWLATLGLTVLGSIGLLGAAELRKRQDDDSYEV